MEPESIIVFGLLGGFALVIILLVYITLKRSKQRKQAYQEIGLASQFQPWPEAASSASLNAFDLFGTYQFGTFQMARVQNGWYRQCGSTFFCVGDMTYSFGRGKSKQEYTQTILLVVHPPLALPPATVLTRGIINKLMRKGDGEEVPLQGVPAFAAAWRAISPQPAAAAAMLSEPAAAAIMSAGDLWWMTLGTQVLVFESRKTQKTTELAAWFNRVAPAIQCMLASHGHRIEIPTWTHPA